MKNIIINFLQYFFSNHKFFLKFKDTVLLNPSEHLLRTYSYISKNNLIDFSKNIIDIGAANGGTCIYFSNKFPNHKIIGFEPVKSSYELAISKTISNYNIKLSNLALSNYIGEATINVLKDPLTSSLIEVDQALLANKPHFYSKKFNKKDTQIVSTSTLDLELSNIDKILLIKIDTQGTELQILQGGIETLKKTKLILVEMNNHFLYKNSCQYFEVDNFLRLNNFNLKDIYVTYRSNGNMDEYDALYINNKI